MEEMKIEQHSVNREYVDLTVFVSLYNEADYIVNTLDNTINALNTSSLTFEVIVIDDCSADGSFTVVKTYIQRNPSHRILLFKNNENRGLGDNFFTAAMRGKGRYFRMVCGDDVEPFYTLKEVFSKVGAADIILPYHERIIGKPKSRQFLSKTYTAIVNFLSGNRVRYYNGLPVLQREDVLKFSSHTAGFGFQAELICRAIAHGRTFLEIPVLMIETKGSRALSLRNIFSVLHVFINIIILRCSTLYHRKL